MVKCGCCSLLFWVASLVCTCFGVNGFFLPKSITLLCRLTLQKEKQRGKAKVIGKQIRLDSQRSLTQGCFDISHPAFRIPEVWMSCTCTSPSFLWPMSPNLLLQPRILWLACRFAKVSLTLTKQLSNDIDLDIYIYILIEGSLED